MCAHMHTKPWSHFHQRLCLAWLLWLWIASISTVTNHTRDPRSKKHHDNQWLYILETRLCSFLPVQWFKVQSNTWKWEKMKITLDGWLTAGMFFSKSVQNVCERRSNWDVWLFECRWLELRRGNRLQIWNRNWFVLLSWKDYRPTLVIRWATLSFLCCI